MESDHSLEERLPYSTRPLYLPDGSCVEEFIIPEEDKEIVLGQLAQTYPSVAAKGFDDLQVYEVKVSGHKQNLRFCYWKYSTIFTRDQYNRLH